MLIVDQILLNLISGLIGIISYILTVKLKVFRFFLKPIHEKWNIVFYTLCLMGVWTVLLLGVTYV